MVFSSIPFLCYFLPISLVLYFLSPKKLKNIVLLIVSLFFYAWGEPKFLPIMFLTVTQGYLFGILIEKSEGKKAKIYFLISVFLSLGSLAYFKYADFVIENINLLTGLSITKTGSRLPIGISFYTFQILTYTIDVYRRQVPAQRSFVNMATYIALFPQLIAGPIVRYSTVCAQLDKREHSFEKCAYGARRFAIGLAKKVIIANPLSELCKIIYAAEKSVAFLWLYAFCVMASIYFDFSGYSDMAIGLGKIFGFDFNENFNYPFISKSISEFWRRWHISLGSFFREYVYIPLGGNRVSKVRYFVNLMVVWFLTGLWHGAAWNFVIWGVYYGVLIWAERLIPKNIFEKTAFIRAIFTPILVMVSFVIFNAENMADAISHIMGLFGLLNIPLVCAQAVYYFKSYAVILAIALVGATPLAAWVINKMRKNNMIDSILNLVEPFVLASFILISIAYIVDGSFNPFLYFRF